MMLCALALAAMIVLGLAGRAELKMDRAKLRILAVWVGVIREREFDVLRERCRKL